jgi:hypothetical protein
MPRTPKREPPPAEKLAPVPNEILDQFAPDRPLSAGEVEAATRRFKKALIERALGAELSHHLAKTLRSKLQREYQHLPHVTGEPFALALADFHAPASMVWSREALPTDLYGIFAHAEEGPRARVAVGTPVDFTAC